MLGLTPGTPCQGGALGVRFKICWPYTAIVGSLTGCPIGSLFRTPTRRILSTKGL